MRRQEFILLTMHSMLLAVLCISAGCQRPCQPPRDQPLQSITETQWRLVETTAPEYQNDKNRVTRFNFEIWQFGIDGTGTVSPVRLNSQLSGSSGNFNLQYQVDPGSHQMTIRFTSQPTQGAGDLGGETGEQAAQQQETKTLTSNYEYQLSTELRLYRQQDGAYFRFVPFTGVVAPDLECTF